MARIRSIKPEFWTDEKVVELSAMARLLFIGLWNFADDEGRMVLSAKRLKLQIFPADKCDISALLGEIRGNSLVTVYQVDGVEYLQVNGFAKHQKVDKRTESKHPAPPVSAELRQSPPNSPEPRRIPPLDQGREGIKEGSGGDARASSAARGSRLDDWEPDPDLKAWAKKERPDLDIERVFADFRDFWKAKPGAGGVKLDWPATFRRWVRNERVPPLARASPLTGAPKAFVPTDRDSAWPLRLKGFRSTGFWSPSWGPKPGEDGCQCPPKYLSPSAGEAA